MVRFLKQARAAVSMLSPDEVRRRATRRISIGLVCSNNPAYAEMEDFLAPSEISHDKRVQVMQNLYRAGDPGAPERFDLRLYEQGLQCPADAFTFFRADPLRTMEDVLNAHEDLGLSLARNFYPFRKPVVDQVINSVARENAMFAVASALPNVVPNVLEMPWAIGEFASDTAFITMNQVRMALLIAAASDQRVGYGEQKVELFSVIASAFGWRALARELAGFIPFGGGLLPKGAIAFAATYVLGKGMERFHGLGYGLTHTERRDTYQLAYEKGKTVVSGLINKPAQ
jgi:hypothetical protein